MNDSVINYFFFSYKKLTKNDIVYKCMQQNTYLKQAHVPRVIYPHIYKA